MLSKRPPHPMIGKLSELLVSGNHMVSAFTDMATITSPRSPLDFKIQSQSKGLKSFKLGGVGLGIVAALEKSSEFGRREILAKYGSNSTRSDPIPCVKTNSEKLRNGFLESEMESSCSSSYGGDEAEAEAVAEEDEEDYTYVTRRKPNSNTNNNRTCVTKVYYDGVHQNGKFDGGDDLLKKFNNKNKNKNGVKESKSIFSVVDDDLPKYPVSDFLSSCHLCRKNLNGKDIYMYRGEKGFCSTECRSSHIMMEERTEQCRTEISSTSNLLMASSYSTSPYSTGILAI